MWNNVTSVYTRLGIMPRGTATVVCSLHLFTYYSCSTIIPIG